MKNKEEMLNYIARCDDYKIFAIDLFCGAGGMTSGIEESSVNGVKCAKVIACVNHDTNAILSHESNHQDVLHFIEDIRTLELSPIIELAEAVREYHPSSYILLHASAECTNFSKAKGGKPRDADSRTLAEHLYRYIESIQPDYMTVENVEEFMSWGDVDDNGKPISMDKGKSYLRWIKTIRGFGYEYDWRILNAADFGAYTSRKRFFGIFARNGLPICFPTPTYSKIGDDGMFRNYKKWRPVKDVLDMEDIGESIFTRKKPLCEKTLSRIYQGLIKFVAGGKDEFIIKYNSMTSKGKYSPPSIDEPCPTITCQRRLGLVWAMNANTITTYQKRRRMIPSGRDKGFLPAYYGHGHNHSLDAPSPTITTVDKLAMITPEDGTCQLKVCGTDMMSKIIYFMKIYNIIDIKMRMLKIVELKKIMGFPENYVLVGTKTDQTKYIGNAVEVNMARCLCEGICRSLSNKKYVVA